MKKNMLRGVILLASVALLFSACNKDNEVKFKVFAENYNCDKAHINDNNYAVWDNNDQICINAVDNIETLTIDGDGYATTTTEASDNGYTAAYPASLVTSLAPNGGTVVMALPTTQAYAENGAGQQIVGAPMAANTTTEGTFRFKNLCSLLAINIGNVSGSDVTIDSINVTCGSQANGMGIYTFNNDENTVAAQLLLMSGGTNSVALTGIDKVVSHWSFETFYVVLPAGVDCSTLNIDINTNNGTIQKVCGVPGHITAVNNIYNIYCPIR